MNRMLELYPRSWRDRYENEFLGILEARPPTARDRLDIVRGAIDARLDPQVPDGNPRAPMWQRLTQSTVVLAVLGGVLWIVASYAFATAAVDPDLGYRDSGNAIWVAVAAAALSALAAIITSRSLSMPKITRVVSVAMLAGAVVMMLPWPFLVLGFIAAMVGTLLFGLLTAPQLGKACFVLAMTAIPALGFNTEDDRALWLVPIGIAWMLFGTRLAWTGRGRSDLGTIQ